MNEILQYFILLPFFGFVISLLIPEKRSYYFVVVLWNCFTQLAGITIFTIVWLLNGSQTLNLDELTIVKTDNYTFLLIFTLIKLQQYICLLALY